jgi:hypothetical protein
MSNCLFFALGHWWKRGGYFIVRRSHYGWWPHFLWSSDLAVFEQYAPLSGGRLRWFPPLLFKGHVKSGPDTPRTHSHNPPKAATVK